VRPRGTGRPQGSPLHGSGYKGYIVVTALVTPAEWLKFELTFYLLYVKKYGIMNVR